MPHSHLIDTKTAHALVATDALSSAELVPTEQGWHLELPVGRELCILVKARSQEPRTWADAQRALVYARFELRISTVTVRMVNWCQEDMQAARSKPRRNRAEALRQIHLAATHDKWFRAQVEEALQEANRPGTTWHDWDNIKQELEQRRAALEAKRHREG